MIMSHCQNYDDKDMKHLNTLPIQNHDLDALSKTLVLSHFEINPSNHTIKALFSGGPIVLGKLIGLIENENVSFRYTYLNKKNELKGSNCLFLLKEHANTFHISDNWTWSHHHWVASENDESLIHPVLIRQLKKYLADILPIS